jgi:hypothetical protein
MVDVAFAMVQSHIPDGFSKWQLPVALHHELQMSNSVNIRADW